MDERSSSPKLLLYVIEGVFNNAESTSFYRSGTGNVRCNTLSANYDTTQQTTGFGGNGGIGVTGCPYGYFGVGKQCVYFPTGAGPPTGTGALFSDAVSNCGSHNGDLLYSPTDIIQNAVVRAALTAWVSTPHFNSHQLNKNSRLGVVVWDFGIFEMQVQDC